MNTILRTSCLVLTVLALLSACKKKETPDPTPEPTNNINIPADPGKFFSLPGTPIGAVVSACIGASGGSITSADGKATLTVPAGALSSNTTIGIQEITNTGPWGVGSSYRFTPEGLVFSTPATLTINYDPADLQGKPAELMWIYTQVSDGSWKASVRSSVNTGNNSISTPMKHFSDWGVGRFLEIGIYPANPVVMVNQKVNLYLTGFKYEESDEDDYLAPLVKINFKDEDELNPLLPIVGGVAEPFLLWQSFVITGWSLNGTMAPTQSAAGSLVKSSKLATYTAPGQVPANNPVAVSVHLKAYNYFSGNMSFLLTTNITVIQSNLMLAFNINGTDYSYYQWGYNNQVPPDPLNNFQVGCFLYEDNTLQINGVKIENGQYGPYTIDITIANPSVINRTMKGPIAEGYDDFYFIDGDMFGSNSTTYSISYVTRMLDQNGFCETQDHNSDISLSITKYEGPNGIIEGTFNGKLYMDPNQGNECLSDVPANISGFFRLKVMQ